MEQGIGLQCPLFLAHLLPVLAGSKIGYILAPSTATTLIYLA
jgi:hypothetical protein